MPSIGNSIAHISNDASITGETIAIVTRMLSAPNAVPLICIGLPVVVLAALLCTDCHLMQAIKYRRPLNKSLKK